ncbi:beta-1,6-N-acetylglucosaminyltransferase [Modestobacter sp. URMC 112]
MVTDHAGPGNWEADRPNGAVDQPVGSLACVVLAHDDPRHVRRLIDSLDPFPVFLHCDARTPGSVFEQMTAGLPDRVQVLPRRSTPWAGWGLVAAELDGYRAALATTRASHVALLSGSDYPVRSSRDIARLLGPLAGRSVTWSNDMPIAGWELGGGLLRLRFSYAPWRKHMLLLPVPRPLPSGVVPAGGSQSKVLARSHAQALLRVVDQRPDLPRRWRRTWIPDETFVYSVLHSPALVPGWRAEHVPASAWFIRWPDASVKSPPWLGMADLPELRRALDDEERCRTLMFARKFGTAADTAVLDEIDRSLRVAGTDGAAGPT